MQSRRNLVSKLMASAAAAIIPGVDSNPNQAWLDFPQNTASGNCSRTHSGPHAQYFQNVMVYTHEGQRALFYDDLLRDKMVLINFMSVKNEALFPVTRNLSKVQRLLGDRLGRDLFMYSITVDPEHDTPQVLRAFAEKYEARRGWIFLTAEPAVIESLRTRLFMSGDSHDHGDGPAQDCSLGLIRYGNEADGFWGSVPAKSDPQIIATRLSWIQPQAQPATGTPKRKGPMPLAAEFRPLPGR
ncbi:MAG TPA: SCO family protein [Pyrinomonadaceae bacterium]|nr:SCO family protein [Pyrinomonadaceae bacterium]